MSENTFVENIGEIVMRKDQNFWILPEIYIKKHDLVLNSPLFSYLGEKWRFVMSTERNRYDYPMILYLWRKFHSDLPDCKYIVELDLITLNNTTISDYYMKGYLDNDYGFKAVLCSRLLHAHAGQCGLFKIYFRIKEQYNTAAVQPPIGTSNEKSKKKDSGKQNETDNEGERTSDEENGEKKSGLSDDKGIKTLLENFRQILLDGRMSDAVLKVDNREFKVHKVILVARSPVFASMFEHDMTEKNDNVVDIPDCAAESFEVFLHYIYSGSVEKLSASNVYNVYYAADKYRVDDLKEKCVKFMIDNISVETFCDVIALSLRHGESKLQKVATDFFCKNMKKIIKTVQWQTYLDENSTQANELLIKAVNA